MKKLVTPSFLAGPVGPPVQLDVSTAKKITKNDGMFKEKSLMARNDVWHRIRILHGAKYEKEYLLKKIVNAVEPADLIPVKYQLSGNEDTYFLARNCCAAIENLCKNNLIIKSTNNDPIILQITLGFASIVDLKVSIQPLILTALTKRHNPDKKSLNLESFHRDDAISKHVYCPLSQTKIFSHVLRLTKTTLPPIEHINLQNNELVSLTALENSNLITIKSMDLRNNCLLGMETLTPLRSLTIVELWLDGNPLCENYSSSQQYIESAKKYCPNIIKLDGIFIDSQNIPPTIDSYFPNKTVESIVKQFVNHFFFLHDQKNNSVLRGLYNKNAMYSMTIGTSNLPNKRNLGPYLADSRNLLQQLDFNRIDALLCQGPDEILGALKRLPFCIHDRNTLHYDVFYSVQDIIAFTVQGVLILNPMSQLLSFNRTFVLKAMPDNEYCIINDQYHVDTIVPENCSTNFENSQPKLHCQPEGISFSEKAALLMKLRTVSTMNEKWSTKFLEESGWNLKRAIVYFLDRYRSFKIPAEAFT